MRSAVIDFQGYRTASASLIVKELSIISVNHGSLCHWVFKPPRGIEDVGGLKTNLWVKNNIHGMDWNFGDVRYETIKNVLQPVTEEYEVLWGKGAEKCKFIEDLIDKPVYDLHDFGCPNLKILENDKFACHFHLDTTFICSLNQARRLATWVKNNSEAVDFQNGKIRKKTYINTDDSPHHLLSFAGFIRDIKNRAKCVYCGLVYDKESVFNPLRYHKTNSPQCLWFKEENDF